MNELMILATVLQLIGMFRQERSNRRDLDHREFYEWLVEHRFEELKNQMAETYHLSSEVDRLLQLDQKVIIERLDRANAMLADIVSHMEGFASLTRALVPQVGLSEDATYILKEFVSSGAKRLIPDPSGAPRLSLDGTNKWIGDLDPRFLDDDLNSLLSYGLVTPDPVMKFRSYLLTRRGESFANSIK